MAYEGKNAMGSGGYCICPKCGNKVPHVSGLPCIESKCEKCGSAMLRENSEHHQALKDKKKDK